MKTVFLDTVGLVGLWDDSDQWHTQAGEAMERLLATPHRLVSSLPVLYECGNAASRTPYRGFVLDLYYELEGRGDLLVPTTAEADRAWTAYFRGEAGAAGIVDHLTFELMRRVGAAQAFTNDRHFTAAGFEVLF